MGKEKPAEIKLELVPQAKMTAPPLVDRKRVPGVKRVEPVNSLANATQYLNLETFRPGQVLKQK